MKKTLLMLGAAFVLSAGMAFAATISGTVSDSMCGAKHAHASATAAKCVAKCVTGGAKYVLVSHGKVYQLDAQDKFADYAGKYVHVTGTVSGDSITVESVAAGGHHMAKPASSM